MATYSVDDLIELIRYHLVLSEESRQAADANLMRLFAGISSMATHPLVHTAQWLFCDRCGCAVDTDVVADDGNWTADAEFLCSSCLYPDDE